MIVQRTFRIFLRHQHLPLSFNTLPLPLNPPYKFFLFFFSTLIFSLRFFEHLKVTILLASKVRSFPVAGFLPLRDFFSFTMNLPKPEIKRSSPDSRVCLMISKRASIVAEDSSLERSWFL